MKLLFVCSGNICRSPMAERIAEAVGDELGLRVEARSAGTLGIEDAPASSNAIRAVRDLGIDLSDHRSQPLTDELVTWADWVLVMEYNHAAHLREYFPELGDRLMLLGNFAGVAEIEDPVGRWIFTFRRVKAQIETGVRAFLVRAAR